MTTCVQCQHFTTKGHPAHAAVGLGQCTGFLAAIQSFVSWDAPACRLFRAAKPIVPREKFSAEKEAMFAASSADIDATQAQVLLSDLGGV